MSKPYVVSADICLLLNEWASQNRFILPGPDFIAELRSGFCVFMRNIFPVFEFVPEAELVGGITDLVAQSGLLPVSLDRVYFHSATHLDITRLVDNAGNDRGLAHRPDTASIIQQFRRLKEISPKEIVLVDDVVFTGELLERIIHCLSRVDIQVPLVCTGIGIAEGIRRINQSKREVRCVRKFEEVIDEICERDFYPGVPLSGRLLVGDENIGTPYLLPFGNPGKWASIPSRWQATFSKFCIQQTIQLFEEIERRSKKPVDCSGLGRCVVGLPRDGTRFVDALRAL